VKNYLVTKINPADVQQVVDNQSILEKNNARRKYRINKVNCGQLPPMFAEGSAAVIMSMTLLILVHIY